MEELSSTMAEPTRPEDVAAVSAVAEVLWQLDEPHRSNVARTFSEARAAETTHRYERAAVELWSRGWLDLVAIAGDAGGLNSA